MEFYFLKIYLLNTLIKAKKILLNYFSCYMPRIIYDIYNKRKIEFRAVEISQPIKAALAELTNGLTILKTSLWRFTN